MWIEWRDRWGCSPRLNRIHPTTWYKTAETTAMMNTRSNQNQGLQQSLPSEGVQYSNTISLTHIYYRKEKVLEILWKYIRFDGKARKNVEIISAKSKLSLLCIPKACSTNTWTIWRNWCKTCISRKNICTRSCFEWK